jgi:iron(III) transport system ATP-binding protein
VTRSSASVKFERLTKAFGQVRAIDDLSLDVASSEMLVLIGPSGCGKTTTLRCLAGLERPTSGIIRIGDRTVTDIENGVFVSPEKRRIGMVFQSYAVWPHMNAFENVAYPLRAMGHSTSDLRPKVETALKLVQLDHLAERYSSQLSGGQQQRVALARSLVAEPDLLLFDEPLSNLDANLRTQMRIEIKQLQRRIGFTAVYVTHDQSEALAIADKLAVMQGGVLRQIGSPRDVYSDPANSFIAGFIGATNLLKATFQGADGAGARVEIDGGFTLRAHKGYAGAPGDRVIASIRPDMLTLSSTVGGGSAENAWPCEIALATFGGDAMIYHLRLGPHMIEARTSPRVVFNQGDRVWASSDSERVRILKD